MRKVIVFLCVMMFVIAGAVTVASAGNTIANTNQKGSLLMFPLIKVCPEGGTDTLIAVGNDQSYAVNVNGYWINGYDQSTESFNFRIMQNQTVWFRASTGANAMDTGDEDDYGTIDEPVSITVPPFMGTKGALVLFAVDAGGNSQIRFNHLYGNAVVMDFSDSGGEGSAFGYNSWNFAVRSNAAENASVGTPGMIKLDGNDYDASPQYLVFNFPAVDAYGIFQNVDLALLATKLDVRTTDSYQDLVFTKATFSIWNDNLVKYNGVYQCMGNTLEKTLDTMQANPQRFALGSLQSTFGRFRVQGMPADPTICTNCIAVPECDDEGECEWEYQPAPYPTLASPLVGLEVLMMDMDIEARGSGGFWGAKTALAAGVAGCDKTGFVKWDQGGVVPENIAR